MTCATGLLRCGRSVVAEVLDVGGDEGVVVGSAAGHGDVGEFAAHAGPQDCEGGVDGHALGAVCGGGVAEFNVLGDVVGRQPHRRPARSARAAALPAHDQRPVV